MAIENAWSVKDRVELIDVIDGDRKDLVGYEPSAEVARTVMLRLAPSASRSIAPATVTTPVLASIAKRPPSLSCRL